MNKTLEELKDLIRARVERFGYMDQAMMYTELINFCDEENRTALQQEYGISGWEDEDNP